MGDTFMSSQSTSLPVGQRLSFLELFEEYPSVEIPLIQRDYAQGRGSAKATAVRKRFLASLKNALQGTSTLSLNFVYGEVNDDRIFQPIDGQQRLTTLFLLHWFLAQAADQWRDFQRRMTDERGELRFTYSVRPSSRRFFSRLIDYSLTNWCIRPSCSIKQQGWFFQSWLHDPTIIGALTMIDSMHETLVSLPEVTTFYDKLLWQSPITMDVLNLGRLGLSEDIYIKMNARGKDLTGFEKFKAWLIETHWLDVDNCFRWPLNADDALQWPVILDGDWLDLFWYFQDKKSDPAAAMSEVYFRTFVALAVNHHASEGRFIESWRTADTDYQEAIWKELFTQPCLQHIFQSLSYLTAREGTTKDCNWPVVSMRRLLKENNVAPFGEVLLAEAFFEGTAKDISYDMRLWLHAICVFFSNRMLIGGREEIHWFRVIRNILANSNVEAKRFKNALSELGRLGHLAVVKGSVLSALEDDMSLVGFKKEQMNEEKRKARLIETSPRKLEWEQQIIRAESHDILHGQIDLLLPKEDDLETFTKRVDVFNKLYDEAGSRIGKEKYLLVRAVLARSESFTLGWQERICLRDTSSNWRDLLDRNCDWPNFREGMLVLIDFLVGKDDYEKAMRDCLKSPVANEPWMLDIIRFGDRILKQSDTKKIQNYNNNGVFCYYLTNSNENDILLGRTAALRNHLIEWLIDRPEAQWKIASMPMERCRLPVAHVDAVEAVFFRGHSIKLTNSGSNGFRMSCQFEYTRLVISDETKVAPDYQIAYPENGDLMTLHGTLNSRLQDVHEGVERVLHELSNACEAFPRQK